MLDTTRAYGLAFHLPARDSIVGASLRDYGEFARPELDLLTAYLRHRPGAFLDVGANIGAFAAPLARMFGQSPVMAFEANASIATILSANAAVNGLDNLRTRHLAIGEREQVVRFPTPDLAQTINFGAVGLGQQRDAPLEPVLMLTLDQCAPPNTSVVKIDVEGYEPHVIEGAADLIRRQKPVFLIEASDNTEAAARAALRMMTKAGYRLHWTFAPFVTPSAPKRRPPPEKIVLGDFNVLCLPEGAPLLVDAPELPSADSPWSHNISNHGYMRRYGY
jgi:FkbM family methyltransferase